MLWGPSNKCPKRIRVMGLGCNPVLPQSLDQRRSHHARSGGAINRWLNCQANPIPPVATALIQALRIRLIRS